MVMNTENKILYKNLKQISNKFTSQPSLYNLQTSTMAVNNLVVKYWKKHQDATLLNTLIAFCFDTASNISSILKKKQHSMMSYIDDSLYSAQQSAKNSTHKNHIGLINTKSKMNKLINMGRLVYNTMKVTNLANPFLIFSTDEKSLRSVTPNDFYYLVDTLLNTLKFAPQGFMMLAHINTHTKQSRAEITNLALREIDTWAYDNHKLPVLVKCNFVETTALKQVLYEKTSSLHLSSKQLSEARGLFLKNSKNFDVLLVTDYKHMISKEPQLEDVDNLVNALKNSIKVDK